MSSSEKCPHCGVEMKDSKTGGVCSRCLMAANFETRTLSLEDSAGVTPPLSPEEMKDRFPNYEILGFLGRGGMGVVYQAQQKALDRLVAIKVLAGEWQENEAFAERFEKEAKTLALLSHANIVTVYDFGEADGIYYIVMEFIDGVNLRDLLESGKLAPEQALEIVPSICEALEFAHRKGIVHRDIKPENILLDSEGRVKVADFGIASLVGDQAEKAGTPPYTAPEQLQGASDERADIYSLGVVLYEMLTGERPVQGALRPSEKAAVGSQIDDIVLRAMDKEPHKRLQSAGEFRKTLEAVQISKERTVSIGAGTNTTKKKGCLSYWWLFIVCAFFTVLLGLAGGGLTAWLTVKKFKATVIVQHDPSLLTSMSLHENRSFFETQFEIITASKTLDKVIEELDLETKWKMPKHQAYEALRGMIEAESIPGTDLLLISVTNIEPSTSAEIANAVAETYLQKTRLNTLQIHRRNLERLEEELEKMEGDIATAPQARELRIKVTNERIRFGQFQEESNITLHQGAEIPTQPISPSATLILILGALVGLVLSLPASFLSWLFVKRTMTRGQ